MRVAIHLFLCLHLTSVTASVQALGSACAEDEVSSEAGGCPGDEPGSEEPCSENCGGCVRCPVASDLPVPLAELSPFELPRRSAPALQSLRPSRLGASDIFRPPRAASSFSV